MAELNQAADEQVEKQLHPPHKSSTDRNSPLAVAQEYELLCSNEWQEAREALDEYSDFKVKVKDKCEILTSTLTVSSQKCSVCQFAYDIVRKIVGSYKANAFRSVTEQRWRHTTITRRCSPSCCTIRLRPRDTRSK